MGDGPTRSVIPPWLLPIVTSVVALGVGTLFGGLVVWLVMPPEIEEVLVPRALTKDELAIECAPLVLQKTTELEAAESKVTTLKATVVEKEERVAALEQEMKTRAERGRALVLELESAKAELREAKEQLKVAQEEKNQLIEELKETVITLEHTEQKLEAQIEQTEYAKEDALSNKYFRFIGESQLEVCERGNRKKLGQCRETVERLLQDPKVRDRFAHCIRSGQATPAVMEIDKKDAKLPAFAQWLDESDRIVKGFYVNFCDPTLPERGDGFLHEEHLPGAATASAGSFAVENEEFEFAPATTPAATEPAPAPTGGEQPSADPELGDLLDDLEDLPD